MPLHHRAALSDLPHELIENIAYHLALAEPLGPPAHLIPLLQSCAAFRDALALPLNPCLYARIFEAKFDWRAPARRLPPSASNAPARAAQLVRYCRTLQVVRRGDIHAPDLLDHFYRLYALCLENDGRNAEQLRWARFDDFMERYLLERLWEGRHPMQGWPLESAENAFAVWLFWFSLTPQRLATHSPELRAQLMGLLRPYATYAFRYPPFYAPDNHFRVPLATPFDTLTSSSVVTPHGYYPQYRDPQMCAHAFAHGADGAMRVAEPPLGLAARLAYIALQEHEPMHYPGPNLIPADRSEADALGVGGPTVHDYAEFDVMRAARPPDRGAWDWSAGEEPVAARVGVSAEWECDWARWRGCYDPWLARPVGGRKFTPGSLSGMWGGRLLNPHLETHEIAVLSATFTPALENPRWVGSFGPLYFDLREHHCVALAAPMSPAEVVPSAPLDEGVGGAYCPREFLGAYPLWAGKTHAGRAAGVRLAARMEGRYREWVYETWDGHARGGHDEETCGMCKEAAAAAAAEAKQTDEDADADVVMATEDEQEDGGAEQLKKTRQAVQGALGGMDVDEYIDGIAGEHEGENVRKRECDGIQDVFVTGETPPQYAQAWHGFRLYGRVRAWDGLVVLVRVPVDGAEHDEPYVFRGYVVGGRTLVGAWRHAMHNPHQPPYEGMFVVSRMDAPAPAAAAQ